MHIDYDGEVRLYRVDNDPWEGHDVLTAPSARHAARWLQDGRPHVMGERFGTADILLTSCLVWAGLCGIDLPQPLANYRDRVASRPGYQAAMASNDPSNATTDGARSE